MMYRRKSRIGLFGLAVLMLVSACAPMGDISEQHPKFFSEIQAAEVFAAGYTGVTEKYIDKVTVKEIALEGMRGLGAVDPALTVSETNGRVVLAVGGNTISTFPTPRDDDVNGWANLTADISLAARGKSAEMKAAGSEAIYEAVFDGVLSGLDIYSRYAGTREAKQNRAKRDGFGGIGIRYNIREGVPVISSVMEKTPAALAGLRKGDRITRCDGRELKGLTRREISALLRGPTQTRIELSIERVGILDPLQMALERAHIFPSTVTETVKDGIFVLKVKSFNQDTARSMAKKMQQVHLTHGNAIKGIVLDLRGNPGGLLKQSVKVADLLLSQGKIISTRGRHADSIHNYEATGRDLAQGLPLVVMVDGKSASAAEIVAAALQDRERAILIGTTSFGKGSVQTVVRLPNDGEITLTWSRLVAPSGYMFHGLGVLPAICTSGAGDDVQAVIRKVMKDPLITEKKFYSWRKPGLQDKGTQTRLRTACPSQRRADNFDMRIARQLINDQTLYARVLTLTAETHEARY